jgi:hypothetical protein
MGLSSLPPTPGLSYKRQYFASSGTFTLPMSAQNKFDAVLVSGGGGGGRAKYTSTSLWGFGGGGGVLYATEVFCTNGTTLTVTVGAGGAGCPAPGSTFYATAGTASSISGIAGNGVSTSITSPAGNGGRSLNVDYQAAYPGNSSSTVSWRFGTSGKTSDKFSNAGSGFGTFQRAVGSSQYGVSRTIFETRNLVYTTAGASRPVSDTSGFTGGPIPLLGNYLHAAVGSTGTTGTVSGSGSTANTFFAGQGGSNNNSYQTVGTGGGGGSGGRSTTGATLGGTGGNGTANTGGGGGAGGKNTATITNTGAGGTGGSGFVIIGYWG